ncbi:MAG: thiamine pyrophosphate-dependent enzyme [Bacillota bacterium]|nr:thiamine pyrophosphate-dependent enzyme [Bacillota bacterium]
MEWMTKIDAPGKTYLMQGNEAVVRGAVEAGIHFAASYPGSPSSQILGILGNIAKERGFYAEWSANETVALEACLGASFANARSICIVKQNGLLVVGDALHCGALSGVKGGLVVVTSDDPSSHSSTNEFDSRHMAISASVPLLEPSSLQESKDIIPYAFELSEQLGQIVIVRITTRICHGRGGVKLGELPKAQRPFRHIGEWERMVCINWRHEYMLEQLDRARALAEDNPFNHYSGPAGAETLIITGGTGRLYTQEALTSLDLTGKVGVLTLASLWPLPERLLAEHLRPCKRLLVIEEVDPFIERNIAALCGKLRLDIEIAGREAGIVLPRVRELTPDVVKRAVAAFCHTTLPDARRHVEQAIELPERELTFCAGCPHRATFFLLKRALKMDELPGVVIGDIGCYTMAGQRAGQYGYHFINCMGSGVNSAEGLGQLTAYGFKQTVLTMAGDSTFFHSSLPGLVNAQYHNANMLFIILDNSATAMTGFQPHPGTGLTAMGDQVPPLSIQKIVEAIGCSVTVADPFEVEETTELVNKLLHQTGMKVLILRQPCATLAAKSAVRKKVWVDPDICRGEDCGCGKFCSRVWNCPGNSWDFEHNKAKIDEVVCVGCGVCAKLCPAGAIKVEGGEQ